MTQYIFHPKKQKPEATLNIESFIETYDDENWQYDSDEGKDDDGEDYDTCA